MKSIRLLLLLLGIVLAAGMYYYYYVPKYVQGTTAPDFEATTLQGQPFKLSALRGQYVLLDFWGSWCAPCRAENPQLVNLHQQWGSKGFTIVSIGLETSKEAWLRAIEKDGLQWQYHYTDLQRMKSPLAQLYGVHSIPTHYLINPEGTIIGVNLTAEKINSLLSEKLAAQ